MQTYWYVKARNCETGNEVQRLSTANGATSEPEAELDMRSYLDAVGRMNGDADSWEICEVSR